MISLGHYLILSGIVFSIGLIGVTTSRNVLKVLLSLELLLAASNLSFVAFSKFNGDYAGQLIVFFVILVAAAEVAIGLAIIVLMYRRLSTIQADELKEMKW
ncbi:MAG: NADH-quinone oxidoreductase subunit NuoK [Candidatus Omnitrophica bacterium]|nr:NADH-quinone oxidoreductase subunit NuoK [Candidatus Omnitrophota bacterium]MDE2221751.1 NADH-quinone oxidoreductase subunit NuoK [Candidatus Omnitrophota bacterium]